jgi:hypothetical protein
MACLTEDLQAMLKVPCGLTADENLAYSLQSRRHFLPDVAVVVLTHRLCSFCCFEQSRALLRAWIPASVHFVMALAVQ